MPVMTQSLSLGNSASVIGGLKPSDSGALKHEGMLLEPARSYPCTDGHAALPNAFPNTCTHDERARRPRLRDERRPTRNAEGRGRRWPGAGRDCPAELCRPRVW